MPYATNRLDALAQFDPSPLARYWRDRLATPLPTAAIEAAEPEGKVKRRDCAPLPRRIAAALIDLITISAILKTPLGATISTSAKKIDDPDVPEWVKALVTHASAVQLGEHTIFTLMVFFVYSAVLVGLSGQTLGMMVMELRVVTTRYSRPTIIQSVWRYIAAFASALTFFIAFAGFFVRVHPHDRVSGTRLVRGRKAT
jgi:uncharacterized RDD family membrane protein YckC